MIAKLNVKPRLPEEITMKLPEIVNVCTLISSISPVKVTTMLAGITIEQLPKGTVPLAHVDEALNEPD